MMTAYTPATSFRDTVEEALKHFNDPAWLGTHAPLAAPYLLARHLDTRIDAPLARGRVLQDLLKRAAAQLDGKYGPRSQDILEQYYFRGLRVDVVCDSLNLSRATFHTSRNTAIDSLAEIVTREIQPALALETPPTVVEDFFARRTELAGCLAALRQKQTVLLTGSGGMGKTTLGSHLARAWGERHVCWFTIRPGLTDHLGTLLLHLGFFLRQHNAPALWQEMIAAQSQIDPKIVLGLVRFSIEQQRLQPLLLCVDEVDLLQSSVGEHEQLSVFLQSLRGLMPLLLIGQHSTFDADHYVALGGLANQDLQRWLLARGVRLSPEDQARLHRYTGGAPHLIDLFITLHQTGDTLDVLLGQLASTPTLVTLLGRVLQRLSDVERGVLMELAVMRAPAPADVWQPAGFSGALQMLIERHLVQSDDYGRVWLLPIYRELVCSALPAEKLAALHMRAAAVFTARGQYTVAASHYALASQPEMAIWLWRQHQKEEINQGQAHAALQVFRPLAALDLPVPTMEELILLLAGLEHLTGNPIQARTDLHALLWHTPLLAIEADELAGTVASDQGDYSTAREFLSSGLARAEALLEPRLAHIHKGIAWSHVKERNLTAAWREILLAEYEVENLKGLLREEAHEYRLAETHFRTALALAQELAHEQGIAKSESNLSGLYARLGRYVEAKEYGESAYASYLRLGKTLAVAGCKINLGFLYNLAGDFAAASSIAEEVDVFLAERVIDPPRPLRSIITQVKAEAALGLGQLALAEIYAQDALQEGGDFIASDATRTLAEVQLHGGDPDGAAMLIDQAIELAQRQGDRYLEAYAWRIAARIERARHMSGAADSAAAMAIDIFTSLNLSHEAIKV